jgi:hypothetical protein
MAKETVAQRKTRYSMLLADYKNRSEELNKLMTVVKGLKVQVKDVPAGIYGDWVRAEGNPREITDQDAVKQHYAELGLPLPTKMTEAPIIVTPKVSK